MWDILDEGHLRCRIFWMRDAYDWNILDEGHLRHGGFRLRDT